MTGHVFNGGWLDVQGLVYDLAGQPLQAQLEEVFTPANGGATRRRTGRLWVDSRRRVRVDVEEEGRPSVMFCYDPARQTLVCGVVDQPETWIRAPWPAHLGSPTEVPAVPPRGHALRMEFTNAEGSFVCRLFDERHDEPDEGVFPEE